MSRSVWTIRKVRRVWINWFGVAWCAGGLALGLRRARAAPSGKEAARPSLTALLVVSITARVPYQTLMDVLHTCVPDAEVTLSILSLTLFMCRVGHNATCTYQWSVLIRHVRIVI